MKDLGLAAIDSHVIFAQMARMESKNAHLQETNDDRASMRDLNATRPNNYLANYLERVTDDVKVSKNHVPGIQADTEVKQSMELAESSLALNNS